MTITAGVLAVLAGLLLYAGHPPLDQGWAGVVALAPLMAALRSASRGRHPGRDGAFLGFVAGLVFFGLLLTWISRFGIVAWVLLVVSLSVFLAAFGAIVAAWGERRGRTLVAVVTWIGLEVARSAFPLGGFPWGLLGATQHGGGPLLPAARVGGIFLVGALAASLGVAVEALVSAALRRRCRPRPDAVGGRRRAPWSSGVAVCVYVAALLVGLSLVPAAPPPTERTLDVAAVQGNDVELPPTVDRLNRVRIERVVERMVVATQRLADEPTPDLVVWPENSLDADYRDDPRLDELVEQAKRIIDGAPLMAGTLLDGPRPGTAYNTLVVIGEDEEITQTYRKRKLVPFGEYVPARRWLDWFPPLDQIAVDYLPGDGPDLFEIDGALVGPVTCFESVFASIVHDQVQAGAEMLIVSTNNASFGRTAASRQHLAFSQLRAVETGRWVVHAGISGISAIVDPEGDVSQRTELFEQTIVRADIPLVQANTPALWLLPWVERAALVGLAVTALLAVLRSRRTTRPEDPVKQTPVLVEAHSSGG